MGTNYYLVSPDRQCEHCGSVNVAGDRIHIGKSSVGWHFSFQATEHKTPEAWKNAIEKCIASGGWIADEYNDDSKISPVEFWAGVQAKRTSACCAERVNLGNGRQSVCVDGVDFNDYEFS